MTNEPPKGLKANFFGFYNNLNVDDFENKNINY